MGLHEKGRRGALLAIGTAMALAGVACGIGADKPTSTEAGPTTKVPTASAAVIDPGDGGNYRPELDPADFVGAIDNPYLPFTTGSTWVYEGTSEGEAERVEIEVLAERKLIMGISATVVRDKVFVADELVEDTLDWFAQDREGNVWYLGEAVKDYEDGKVVSTDGSFEVGMDGARAGIVMPAQPAVGHAYRQEFYKGKAEDMAEVLRVDEAKAVPFGRFDRVVVTRDWNPLDPDPIEEKYYAPGVGLIFETHTRGPAGRVELVRFIPGK